MILVDTTPLVALCDERDAHHTRASADVDRVARTRLVVCEPVMTEACFLLEATWLRARLRAVLDGLRVVPFTPPDPAAMRADVFAWLDRYAEHAPDWADGYLAVACGHDRRARVWTYDSEFRRTWRRPDGTKIPLAGR